MKQVLGENDLRTVRVANDLGIFTECLVVWTNP